MDQQQQKQQQQSIVNGGRNQLELNKGQERGSNRDQELPGSRSKTTKPVVTSTGFDLKKILTLTPPLTKGGGGIDDSNLVTSIGYTRSSLTTTVPSITDPFTQPSLVQSLQPATVNGDSTIVIQTTTPRFGISSSSILSSSSSKTSLKTNNTTSSNNSTGKKKSEKNK